MNAADTFVTSTADSGFDTRTLARRTGRPQSSGDHFAAAASGLGSTRDLFYGGSGRMPNAGRDDTRRKYNLIGGPGNRHLGQLDLWTEREISRHVRERSECFEGMITTWATEVIQCGFTLTPKSDDETLNPIVKEALFGWDGDGGWFGECDATQRMHFWELLTLAEETEVTDGDCALSLDPTGNGGLGSVAIIEGDRILTPTGYEAPAGRRMFNGVEVDAKTGAPQRVFIADEAPSHCHCSLEDGQLFPIFDPKQPADGGILLHVVPKRYTASRRQPWLSTSIRGHDEIEDVFVATRIALRNEACRSTYTKIESWDDYYAWLQTVDPNVEGLAPESALEHSPNPGDHHYANPGETIEVLQSNRPGNNFDSFMTFNLRFVGLPLSMGLEEVVKLFDRNFSASRLSLEGSRRRKKTRQRTIKRRKVHPVTLFAIARLQTANELPADNATIARLACKYPTWPYTEPLKDAKADRELRDMRVKSSKTIAEERGYNFDEEQSELDSEGPLPSASPTVINETPAGDADE